MGGFLIAKKIGCGEWSVPGGGAVPSHAEWFLFDLGFGVASYFRLRVLFFYLMNQKNLLYNDSNGMSFIML